MILKDRFKMLCLNFTQDKILIEKFWLEIEKNYSGKNRHYHNLQHLENMFEEIDTVRNQIEKFDNISFSIFYHDMIYDAASKSNEEKSADFAKKRLESLGANSDDIQKVYKQILATKSHKKSDDGDTDFLLDADLSVLGKGREFYFEYTKQIRKEYSIYPDFLYKPGRKKVLQHFLELESIFKTKYFQNKYEVQARENIEFELKSL
ncbi:HD domain-containing protein [Chryseobacterium terrae]|uniref:Metal-dependent HD superfamily phosphohydrolase n=1 Tax=Chryseobacterium terrae TaxID=3163299 RepID=A0ABW8Y223_9FLAO